MTVQKPEDNTPARTALFWALWDNYTPREKDALIDAFVQEVARGLAKKIRTTELPEIHVDMFDNGTQWAADVIDPEVSR